MLFFASLIAALFSAGSAPIDSGVPASAISADSCGQCHDGQHREWKSSRHGRAYTNPTFQREYSRSPKAWCLNCHTPLREQQQELAEGGHELADEGVNCVACHVRDGRMLAAHRDPDSPHRTKVIAGFGGPSFCGGCHQFNFPALKGGKLLHYSSEPMQDTLNQYREFEKKTGHRGGCRDCHARSREGHAYPGAHSPAMLRRALGLHVCRKGTTVRASVTNRGAGHNVPTGDVHRHVVVRVWRPTAPHRMREAYYGRRYALTAAGIKETTWDSTLAPGRSSTFEVNASSLGGEMAEPISVEVRYVYVSSESAQRLGSDPAYATVYRRAQPLAGLASCK